MSGSDARALSRSLLDLCRMRKLTIATAESCTGGLVAGALAIMLEDVEPQRRGQAALPAVLRQAGADVGDFAQGAGAGELGQHGLHAVLFFGRAELLQGGQNFDALDGIDTQVGFDAGVEVEHLRRIAGALRGDAA